MHHTAQHFQHSLLRCLSYAFLSEVPSANRNHIKLKPEEYNSVATEYLLWSVLNVPAVASINWWLRVSLIRHSYWNILSISRWSEIRPSLDLGKWQIKSIINDNISGILVTILGPTLKAEKIYDSIDNVAITNDTRSKVKASWFKITRSENNTEGWGLDIIRSVSFGTLLIYHF